MLAGSIAKETDPSLVELHVTGEKAFRRLTWMGIQPSAGCTTVVILLVVERWAICLVYAGPLLPERVRFPVTADITDGGKP